MLNEKMEKALNEQINAELFSAYLYYSMAAYFDSKSLTGFSHWMRSQALEEMAHAAKFVDFVSNRGGRVRLGAIEAPTVEWESPAAVFNDTYAHECHVTGLINKLMDLALSQSDHATVQFLQWFVAEQVEEEATADEVVQKLKLVDKTEGGIFMLDQEMARRPIVLPPALTGGV